MVVRYASIEIRVSTYESPEGTVSAVREQRGFHLPRDSRRLGDLQAASVLSFMQHARIPRDRRAKREVKVYLLGSFACLVAFFLLLRFCTPNPDISSVTDIHDERRKIMNGVISVINRNY